MIKTVVIPQNNNLQISIPDKYVGREIEVLLYTKDELTGEKNAMTNDSARFKGLLTNEEAEKYHQYIKQARSEWDRDI